MTKDGRERRVSAVVAWGLFVAWAVHDAEELLAMPGWAQRARPRLEHALPGVPRWVWDRLSVSPDQAAAAIGVMACLVAAAAADGARTGGRGRLFQAVLAGFGWHAVGHLASAAVTRGYTPGVITAPIVVAPYALWAWHRLRRAGVPIAPLPSAAALLVPGAIGGAHAVAAGLLAALRRRPAV